MIKLRFALMLGFGPIFVDDFAGAMGRFAREALAANLIAAKRYGQCHRGEAASNRIELNQRRKSQSIIHPYKSC